MDAEAAFGMALGLVAILSIFVALPWLVLHYIAKARSSGGLSQDDERMLEDLWRSAKAMERRIDTLERLIEIEPDQPRPRASDDPRGDYR